MNFEGLIKMKFCNWIAFILLGMVSSCNNNKGFDVCNHGSETVDSVVCYEPTVLIDTTIKNAIKVAGSLTAKNITANDISVKGPVAIHSSKVNGATDVIGSFEANETTFNKGITIESDKISLVKSIVKGSVVISSATTKPILKISCNTTVTGSVLFDGKPGIIEVSEDSIVQGKVVNGSMDFVKVTCEK